MGATPLSQHLSWSFFAIEGTLLVIAVVCAWLVLPALLGQDSDAESPSLRDLLSTPVVVVRALLS